MLDTMRLTPRCTAQDQVMFFGIVKTSTKSANLLE